MQDTINALGREVQRIVTAPYAPSLQDLYGIANRASSTQVNSWVSHKPCQVAALVDVLVDGLSRSGYALNLLQVFTQASIARDALLHRHPHILDQFLQKAIEDGQAEYISACISILSSPLPHSYITPARLAPFFTRIICIMGNNPCPETIQPLHQLISGLQTSSGILFEIPHETMSSLQSELTKTLRNLDDHMGNLLCLSTFAQISASWRKHKDYDHQAPPWLQSINHFFGPKRGLKTLDLVVLRVILACSANCSSLTPDKAADSIRLAIGICETVERSQRDSWVKANAPKIAKLCEKVTRSGIDPDVQMLGVSFLTALLPPPVMSPGISGTALQTLISKDSRRVLDTLSLDRISRVTITVVACLGQSAVCSLLNYVISSLKTANTAGLASIQLSQAIISGLQSVDGDTFQAAIAEQVHKQWSESMPQLMEVFPRKVPQAQCEASHTCYASFANTENQLLCDVFALFVRSSFLRSSGQSASSVELKLFQALMQSTRDSVSNATCSFFDINPMTLRQSVPTLRTLEKSPSTRQSWRSGLAETLALNAQNSEEKVIWKVEEICQDLEKRCNDAETPLRAVEEERNKVAQEANEMRGLNHELKLRLQQADTTISTLQQEIVNLESHSESTTSRAEELSRRLDAAQKDLQEQRRDSQESANSERERARTRELDLIAVMTEKDDRLEGLQEEVREKEHMNMELRRALDVAMEEKTSLLDSNSALVQEVSRIKQHASDLQTALRQHDEEIQRLLAVKDDMEAGAESLQNKLNEEIKISESLKSELHKAEAGFNMELETARKQFELRLHESKAECLQRDDEISSLRSSMQAAASNATKEVQTKDKKIRYLEKKVQYLRDEQASKAREFSEAQQHIGRLMDVMGFQTGPNLSHKPSRTRSTTGQPQPTPQKQMRSGECMQTQGDDLVDTSFESDGSLTGRRSPKRPRDNAFPLAKTPQVPQLSEQKRESVKGGGGNRRERRILGDVDQKSQNSQPSSQGSRKSHRSQRESFPAAQLHGNGDENHLQDIDLDMDLELSRDFIFTSTPTA
ncbi:hypothetical protein BDV59DRAFT_178968 [Aspergillus ambiguus]|uniref:uncharacterized protein n=1 Tax=Aspergillus ambiguus TaxID=176160 RepID=UPI003CCD887A